MLRPLLAPLGCLVFSVLLLSSGCFGGGQPETPTGEIPEPDLDPDEKFVELRRLEGTRSYAGDLAGARAGDWVLENEHAIWVVASLDHASGFMASGGNLIDAAPRQGTDILRDLFTYFDDTFPRQAVYTELEPGDVPEGEDRRTLVARGHDSEREDLKVTTVYELRTGAPRLTLTTTMVHTGTDTLADFELGDAFQWGRARPYAPGPGFELPGTRPAAPYFAATAEGTAYLWFTQDGFIQGGPHGPGWSDPLVRTVTFTPGDTVRFSREFWVVRGGIDDVLARADWNPYGGGVEVAVTEPRLQLPEHTLVELFDAEGNSVATGGGRTARLPAPAGEYRLVVRHPVHGVWEGEVNVSGSRWAERNVKLSQPAAARLRVTDGNGAPIAARWIWEDADGTADPYLGPLIRAHRAGRDVYTPTGELDLWMPPGSYRVTVTAGTFRDAWTGDVTLEPGGQRTIEAVLPALDIPAGWVAADLHVHAIPSPDSHVSLPDRLRTLACEGIRWFVASDHGERTDYSAVLDTLTLASPLDAVISEEITHERWHINAWPLPAGTSPVDVDDMTPGEVIDLVRRQSPHGVVQLNHPRAGRSGYFDTFEFIASDTADPGDLRLDFDAMEIVNGKRPRHMGKVWEDWLYLLGSGRGITGVGGSDAHLLPVGYPRTLVRLDSTRIEPGGLDLADAVRGGHVQFTNGPFIDVQLGGAGVGDTLRTDGGTVSGSLRVLSPSWVRIDRIEVWVGDSLDWIVPLPDAGAGSVRFDEPFELYVTEGGPVIVRVTGSEPLVPVITSSGTSSDYDDAHALAVTNPIWVEIGRAPR